MARKIDLNKSPESHCPRFDSCSINKCPLSKRYSELKNDSSDPSKVQKEKCTTKKIRIEIGTAFNLPMRGMTSREFNGAKMWENMSDSEKAERTSKLQENSPIARLSRKGYTICPKKKVISQTHGQNGQIGLQIATGGGSVGGVEC